MSKNNNKQSLIPEERVEQIIFIIRNQKVILDSDLAALYGVETKTLNRVVKRNMDRFPVEFMLQLTKKEAEDVRSRYQIGTLKRGGNVKYLPYAFTEHGALMAATILNSPRAVAMSLAIIKTFVKLRQLLSTHKELARRLEELEEKYDGQFYEVYEEIKKLRGSPEKGKRRKIGFITDQT